MEGIKKEKSISKIFAKYIVNFCIVNVLLIVIVISLYTIAFNTGVLLPANYYEQKIEKNRDKISKAESVKDLIPKECRFSVYDLNGIVSEANVPKDKSLEMWDILKNDTLSKGKHYYKVIQRGSEICVVEYEIKVTFANAKLNKYISNPEFISEIIFILVFIIEILIFSKLFKRRVKKEMQFLQNATSKIQMENLDFELEYSNISEINDVIKSLDIMKTELKKSLNDKWELERIQKEQTAAMAHDIKTPLTIIKGNAELLSESELPEEERKFTQNILTEVKNMEGYIKTLIEMMKSDKEVVLKKRKVNFRNLLDEIIKQGTSMCINKHINFESTIDDVSDYIIADESALKRAVSNIISNAVQYTAENGNILFKVDETEGKINISIEDSGRGFTEEELSLATQKFYRGDKSRNSKNHYGMGLYIAKRMIEKHNGTMKLENSKKLGGAKVSFIISTKG